MLQEITPKKFLNQYENRMPQEDSEIICVCAGEYLIIKEDQNAQRYPYYCEVREILQDQSFTYLFAIAEGQARTDYFLDICKSREALDHILVEHSWENISYLTHLMKPKHEAFAGMTAHHLSVWYQNNQICGRCGQPLQHDKKERMMRCGACGNMVFPKIAPAVLAAVQHDGKMLLTKYVGRETGAYALVAGFVEIGETAEEAVAREVMEETGLRIKNIRYYDSQPWGTAGNLMLAYTAELDGDDRIRRDEGELSVAQWVLPEEVGEIDDYSSLTREIIRRFRDGRLFDK